MSAVSGTSGRTASTAAHLLIHAHRSDRRPPADARSLWQRWMERTPQLGGTAAGAHLRVEIAAEPGHPLFVVSDLQGTVEMTVGPGTYDISVAAGRRKRRYTVTLAPGTTFDLNLQDEMQAD